MSMPTQRGNARGMEGIKRPKAGLRYVERIKDANFDPNSSVNGLGDHPLITADNHLVPHSSVVFLMLNALYKPVKIVPLNFPLNEGKPPYQLAYALTDEGTDVKHIKTAKGLPPTAVLLLFSSDSNIVPIPFHTLSAAILDTFEILEVEMYIDRSPNGIDWREHMRRNPVLLLTQFMVTNHLVCELRLSPDASAMVHPNDTIAEAYKGLTPRQRFDKLMVAAEHTVARTYAFYRDYEALYIAESVGEGLADQFLPGNTFDTKHLLVTRSSGHESFIQSSNIILLQDQLAPMRTMYEDTAKAKAAGTLLGFPPPLPPPPRAAPCVSGLPLQVSQANQTQHSSPLFLPI